MAQEAILSDMLPEVPLRGLYPVFLLEDQPIFE